MAIINLKCLILCLTLSTIRKTPMITTILSYTGSFCATIAVIPQIIRVIRLKEANALSYSFLGLRMLAFILFCSAIITTGHILAASSYIFIIGANLYLIFLKYYYTKKIRKKP